MVRNLLVSCAAVAMLSICVADVEAGLFGRAYGGHRSSCCYTPVYTSYNYHNYYGGWGGYSGYGWCGYGCGTGYGWSGYSGYGWGGHGCGTGYGWGGYSGYGWSGHGCGTGYGWGGYSGYGHGWGGYGGGCCASTDQKQNVVDANAYVNVSVPADAKIWVNGRETTIDGAKRRFESRNLTAGKDYKFEVRAQVNKNGRQIEQTQTVTVQGGQTKSLAFDFDANATPVATLTSN